MVPCFRLSSHPTQKNGSVSDKRRVRIFCKTGGSRKVPAMLHLFLSFFLGKLFNLPAFPYLKVARAVWTSLCVLIFVRTLAPLRRIIGRDLHVFSRHHNGGILGFCVTATLECGHEFHEYGLELRDLMNAYTEASQRRARRHRCHPCRDLLAMKKPVRSVAWPKRTAAAMLLLAATALHPQGVNDGLDIANDRSAGRMRELRGSVAEENAREGAGKIFHMRVSGMRVAVRSGKFFDRSRILSTSLNFSARTADVAYTCEKLSPQWREQILPTQSCSGVALYSYGFAFGALGLERMLYKHHPRLARIPQWISTAGAASGIAYSVRSVRGGR